MSKEIFKNITISIEMYEKYIFKRCIEIEIFRKLLELVGDKEDKCYEEFFDIYIKEFKLKKNYDINYNFIKDNIIFNVNISNNVDNIYVFIEVINYYYDDDLFIEIKNLLDNIFITSSSPIIKPNPEPNSEPIPEPNHEPKPNLKYKKKSISLVLRKKVWDKYIGLDIGKFKCLCCNITDIIQMSFHCGHIIAESKGGETNLSNLKPICQNCNLSMGSLNMDDFMKTLI
jgi:hypothetical protein